MSEAKTRQEIAAELGISAKTLNRWITKHGLQLPKGLLCEKYQQLLFDAFGAK